MIKNRIIALTGALICASLTVSAAAPTVTKPTEQERKESVKIIEKYIDDCRNAYVAFRFGKDGGDLLNRTLNSKPLKERPLMLLMCRAYGDGYEDGMKGIS